MSVKRIVSFLIIAALVCASFVIVNAESKSVVYGDDVNANAGSSVSIPVKISGNPGISAIGLKVSYDKNFVTPVSVQRGDVLKSGSGDDSIETSKTSSFDVLWYDTKETISNGVLFIIHFKISEKAKGDTFINLKIDGDNTFNNKYVTPAIEENNIKLSIDNSSIEETTTQVSTENTKPQGKTGVSVSNFDGIIGEEIEIPVMITNNTGIMGYKFNLNFNSEILKIDDVVSAKNYENGSIYYKVSENKLVVLWNYNSAILSDGELFVIKGSILKSGSTSLEIGYTEGDTFDEDYNSIDIDCNNGILNSYSLGDTNMDGDINVKDVTLIQKYLAGYCDFSSVQIKLSDVETDNNVDIGDASRILLYTLKKINKL